VSVRIRLTRTGRKNLPSFRIAAFDGRTRRDGPALEVLGWFNPLSRESGKGFRVDADRVQHWVRRGARLTLAVTELLHRQGVALPAPAARAAAAPPAAPARAPKAPPRNAPFKADPEANARRKRKIARQASRRALAARRAAAAKEAAAAKAATAKKD
jgi:small subunit ribosomal protein S16